MIWLFGSWGFSVSKEWQTFPRVAVPFSTAIIKVGVIHFVHILASIGYDHCVKKKVFSHSAKYVMQSHNGFNLQFPADIWYWTPFHVCLPPAHLQWTVCSYLLLIFQLGCLFFTVEFSEFSMCSDTSLLWDTYFVNTFSQSIAHSIISLAGSFTKQFLNFDGGKLKYFFPFINCEFGVQSKNSA